MTANRVALYSKVSTHHGQDPEPQLRELREYTASRGLTIVQEYIDVGFSGSKDSRPALNQLMADARRRRFDSVLVWNWIVLAAHFGTWLMLWQNSRSGGERSSVCATT